MDSDDPLSQLADIHLPDAIGFWPPAPGWWILLALFLAATLYACLLLFKQWQRNRLCNFALAELEKCYVVYRDAAVAEEEAQNQRTQNLVNSVNAVLRRVALKHFPDSGVASLSGQQWVGFIREHGPAGNMAEDIADALAQGRFARSCSVEPQALHTMAREWIKNLYLARIETTRSTPARAAEHA